MKYRILIFVLKHIFILSFKHRKHDYNTCIFAAVTYHPSDQAANAIATGKSSITADFVQESQLRLPSSDSAISRSSGSAPDCIPLSDLDRFTQHSDGNRQPQAVLPANIGKNSLL